MAGKCPTLLSHCPIGWDAYFFFFSRGIPRFHGCGFRTVEQFKGKMFQALLVDVKSRQVQFQVLIWFLFREQIRMVSSKPFQEDKDASSCRIPGMVYLK